MNQRQRKKLSRHLFEATPLGDAARVKALLRAGADPERRDSEGTTPLYVASVNGEAEIARLLLASGTSPDSESRLGWEGTPLCAAACWGYTETVRQLFTHGVDRNLHEDHSTGRSPLGWAIDGPHPETAALLITAGATLTGNHGPSPFVIRDPISSMDLVLGPLE
ncbi:ankyrin repeat domain-containing protein [Streptomyces sp. NPDC056831]|uniref:ankyrin repeat domain-containing protein n=1 Tax=Streptomyces sp. NPDC056831 TaxID=3345954 RepID=UPI003690961B